MNNGTLHSYPIVGHESESQSFAMIYCGGFDMAFRDISTFSTRISSRRSISQSYPMDLWRDIGADLRGENSVRDSLPCNRVDLERKSAREWYGRIMT